MEELLSNLLNLAVIVFAVSSMLSVGFAHTAADVFGPLREARWVARALVVNFMLVPLLAYFLLQIFPLERSLAVGLFLVASAAGAAFLIKLTVAADSDVALSATLLVVLLPATMVYMPIMVPLALPDAQVSAAAIALPLALTMLLPLALGLLVRAWAERWAQRLQPVMRSLSTAALLVLIAATILANLRGILGIFGTGAIIAATILIGGSYLLGYAFGGRDRHAREVLGLGSAQRNIAAAMVVATQAIDDPNTLSMIVVYSLVTFAVLFPIAAALRKRRTREAPSY